MVEEPKKYHIKPENKDFAFVLFKEDIISLFSFGEDILIMKSNYKTQCICYQSCYEYEGNEKAMIQKIGNEEENQFTVKRIQVYQMEETEEQWIRRETKENEENIKKKSNKWKWNRK